MSESKYWIGETELDEKWDEFVSSSSNGTAFLCSTYLNSVDVNIKAYYCYKSNEVMGALLVAVSENGRDIVEHDHIIYSGIIYRDFPRLNHAQMYSEHFRVQECAAEFLMATYENIDFNLHPSVSDVRPFLWVNYGTDKPKFSVELRYTSVLSIEDFAGSPELDEINAYKEASAARRQEIRYAIKKGVTTEACSDAGKFVSYYALTMARQGIEVGVERLDAMETLVASLVNAEMGMMFQSKNGDGQIGSMAVFLLDNKRAYYLFGANDPEMRNQHTGTAVLWDVFYKLADMGYKEIDLEGVNSPMRGWFKLSFGGELYPYYKIVCEKRGGCE